MLVGKGIRISNRTFTNIESEKSINLPYGKVFLIIDREKLFNPNKEELKNGTHIFIGLQTTTNLEQVKYKESRMIEDKITKDKYVVKLNQIYSCNIDLDEINANPKIDICDLQITKELFELLDEQIGTLEKEELIYIEHTDEIINIIKPKKKEIYDVLRENYIIPEKTNKIIGKNLEEDLEL